MTDPRPTFQSKSKVFYVAASSGGGGGVEGKWYGSSNCGYVEGLPLKEGNVFIVWAWQQPYIMIGEYGVTFSLINAGGRCWRVKVGNVPEGSPATFGVHSGSCDYNGLLVHALPGSVYCALCGQDDLLCDCPSNT
jgi:hypothetical protein